MPALLTAIERARSRTRRRLLAVATAVGVLLLSGGGWRLAHGNRFVCAVPKDRVAAAWTPGDATDPRRQSIQKAFAASGSPTAETSWQRVSKVLDDYMTAWSAMYLQTCEATHTRGEQSTEVLDLRMSCLSDNLNQVSALTAELTKADADVVSHAASAARNFTPVSRCADIALLKSAVPLPKDEKTLREVLRLRRSVAAVATLREVGRFKQALAEASAIRPQVEATGYKPLAAGLLHEIGAIESSLDADPSRAEPALLEALTLAEATADDLTAAKSAACLVYLVGFRLGRTSEAANWAKLGHAILDRIGSGQEVARSWLLSSEAAIALRDGDFERAGALQERATALLEANIDARPYFAIGLSNLSWVLTLRGRAADALQAANRAIEVMHTVDAETYLLAGAHCNQGDALRALGRYPEAENAYNKAIGLFDKEVGSRHPERAFALHGLGTTKLARGLPAAAIPLLSEALESRLQPGGDPVLAAETQFELGRALEQSNGDRRRARALAAAALETYRGAHRTESVRIVAAWLDERLPSSRRKRAAFATGEQ